MKIETLRKIYPYLNKNNKKIKWRRITDTELIMSSYEKQKICNCYSSAVRYALIRSDKGREILKKRIWIEKNSTDTPAYKFVLNVNGKDEIFRVHKTDYLNKFFNLYSDYNEYPRRSGNFNQSECNNFNLALDIATYKMITKYPKEKPWYLRIYNWPNNKKCEYNKPSKAFEWLTGIKPNFVVGENSLKNNLVKNRTEVLNLLKKLKNISNENYSFIVLSGKTKLPIENWHCLPIININKNLVTTKNRRTNNFITVSYEQLLNEIKSIVGINWKE